MVDKVEKVEPRRETRNKVTWDVAEGGELELSVVDNDGDTITLVGDVEHLESLGQAVLDACQDYRVEKRNETVHGEEE